MKSWVVCFDITDDGGRRAVGRLLGRHGRRVQRSVFEILVRSDAELDGIVEALSAHVDEDDDLRLYPLCRTCRGRARDVEGRPAMRFVQSHIC